MKKSLIFCTMALVMLMTGGFTACQQDEPIEPEEPTAHVHDWSVTSTTEATCGEAARTYYVCDECGTTKTERGTAATAAHSYGDDNVCDDCGYIDFSGMTVEEGIEQYGYYIEDVDGSGTYTTGDFVYFGSYPQEIVADDALYAEHGTHSIVLDNELFAKLQGEAGTLPTASGAGDWTSYGYYDDSAVSDYMFYKDVTVDGVRYRGVYMLKYRPYYSNYAASVDYSYIDNEGFALNTVYWFKYSPIKWTVLDYIGGSLLLNSKYTLEGQPFQDAIEGDRSKLVIPGTDIYTNNWEYCSLRSFLNEDFYNTAFNETQQALVQTVTLDNKYSGYAMDSKYQLIQNNTQDKVFLLSYQDVLNTDYGFTEDSTRSHSFTTYATIQGNRTSSEGTTPDGDPACYYMLRSSNGLMYGICGVSKLGTASFTSNAMSTTGASIDGLAFNGDLGVLPALYLKVGK